MILHDQVPCRLSPAALLTACFLVLFALPSWSTATPVASTNGQTVVTDLPSTVDSNSATTNDEDDDAEAALAKAKADLKKAEAALKKIEAENRKSKADAKKAKKDAKKPKTDGTDQKDKPGFDFSQLAETIEKELEGKLGPDFEKKDGRARRQDREGDRKPIWPRFREEDGGAW